MQKKSKAEVLTLTKEEEYKLITLVQQGDVDATDRFIEQYIRLASSLVNRTLKIYNIDNNNPTISYEDLLQVALISFYNCTKTYNPELGAKFSTYAINSATGSILKEISAKRFLVYLYPSTRLQFTKVQREMSNYIEKNNGDIPSNDTLSKLTGYSIEKIKYLINLMYEINPLYVDGFVYEGIEDQMLFNVPVEDELISSIDNASLFNDTNEILSNNYIGINVIIKTFKEDLSDREIARQLKLPMWRIQNIRSRSLKQLRKSKRMQKYFGN